MSQSDQAQHELQPKLVAQDVLSFSPTPSASIPGRIRLIIPFFPTDPLCSLPKPQLSFFQWLQCRSQTASRPTPARPFKLWDMGLVSSDSLKPTVQSTKFAPP